MTVRETWFGVGFLAATLLWFLVGWLVARVHRDRGEIRALTADVERSLKALE
jgi:hypothetical protein